MIDSELYIQHLEGLFLRLKHCPTDGAMGAVFGCAKNRMGDASVLSRTGKMASRRFYRERPGKCEIPMWLLGREESKKKKYGANKSEK